MEQQVRRITHKYLKTSASKSKSCSATTLAATVGGALMLCSSSTRKHASTDEKKKESYNYHSANQPSREFMKFGSSVSKALFETSLRSIASTKIVSCEYMNKSSDDDEFSESYRFAQCLKEHRSLLHGYRQRWTYSPDSKQTPAKSTSWPTSEIPSSKEVSTLEYDFKFAAPGKYKDDIQFRLAYYYLEDDPPKAFSLLQELATRGNHADAMCLFGIVWNEGRCNVEADPSTAAVWFARAAELDHAQACYELAVSLYTGEGVAEDEVKAVEWFERAASKGHAAAAYMLGDCLLDGVGIVRDRAEALEWLVAAGDWGHRGARSRVLAVLEQEEWKDYGDFTDSSRQTFKRKIESDLEYKKWTEEDIEKIVSIERQFTIGGGSGNPVVLERRRSVIAESREREEEQSSSSSADDEKKTEKDNDSKSPTAKDYVRKQLQTKS